MVAANAPATPASAAFAGQLGGVHQVAVVAQRQAGAGLGGAERRLGVLPRGGAGRGVAGVADGEVAAQAAQRRLVEDLADQPEVLVDDDGGAVGHRDAGRLLTAVLEGVQAEIGQLRDLFPRRPDPEDATGVLRSGILGIEVVRQPSITARHAEVPARTTIRAGGVKVATRRSRRGAVRPSWPCWTRERRTDAQRPPDPSDSSPAQRMLRDCSASTRRRGALGGGDALRARVPRAQRGGARENLTFALATRAVEAPGPRPERPTVDARGRAADGGSAMSTSPRRSSCRRRARCGRRCRRQVSSRRGSIDDRRVVAERAAGRARAAAEQRVAGEHRAAGPAAYRQVLPGECPGVCSATSVVPATSNRRARRRARASGRGVGVRRRPRASGRPGGTRSARRWPRAARPRR